MPDQEFLQEAARPRLDGTADRSIAQTLKAILEKRNLSSGKMSETAAALEKMAEKTKRLTEAEALLQGLTKKEQEDLFGSPEACSDFQNCMKEASDCQIRLQEAAEAFRALEVRFQRKTVNLGVIGRRGAGKSRLLQSLSGLPEDYIPSGDGRSCTGVTCVIENQRGLTVPEVYFTLKDEDTLRKEINHELQKRWLDTTGKADGAPQLSTEASSWRETLGAAFQSMKAELDRRGIQMGTAYDEWEYSRSIYYDQWDEWRPLVYPTKPGREGAGEAEQSPREQQEQLEQWKSRMEQWSQGLCAYPLTLLEQSQWAQDGAPRCSLSDLKQVKRYITKRRVADGPEIYHFNSYHIAIREALIRMAFDGVDSRICLVDTVGIGDKAADTRDRMNRAIDVDSDGLIFIHRYPEPGGEYVAAPEIDELAKICGERGSKRPGDWTAFLLNACPKADCSSEWIVDTFDPKVSDAPTPLSSNTVNPKAVLEAAASLKNYTKQLLADASIKGLFSSSDPNLDGRYVRLKYTANVSDSESMKEFIYQFLKQISEKLEAIDAVRREDAEKKRAEALYAEEALVKHLQALSIPDGDSLDMVNKRMERKQEKLLQELSAYYKTGLKQTLASPLTIYSEKIENLLKIHGPKEELPINGCLGNIAAGIWAKQIPDRQRAKLQATEKLYQLIRQIAASSSQEYDKAQQAFKQDIAHFFVKNLGIDLASIDPTKSNSPKPIMESDKDFFQRMKGLLFQKTVDVGDLPQFFDALQRFQLSDSSVMAEAILSHIAAKHLCTYTVRGILDRSAGGGQPAPAVPQSGRNLQFGASQGSVAMNVPASDQDDVVQEIETMLRQQLQQVFNELQEYRKKEESYSIAPEDRLREELIHFAMCFGEPYQKSWLLVFNNLYKDGIILQGELDDFRRIRVVGEQIRQYRSEYL